MTEPLDQLSSFLEAVSFPAGTIIFREGEPTDSFLVIDRGEVRLEVHSDEVDSDATLAFAGPGALLGEIGVLTGAPRSASAIAHTDVEGRRMMVDRIEWLYRERPAEGVALARMLGEAAALRVRSLNQQHEEHLFVDRGDPAVDRMVAQRSRRSAPSSVGTRIGSTPSCTSSPRRSPTVPTTLLRPRSPRRASAGRRTRRRRSGSARSACTASLTGRPASGLLDVDEDLDVARYASPAGVIFAMAPVTEPVSTYVNKVLIALKGRNALILSPHRASAATAAMADDLVQSVLERHGAPPRIVQLVRERGSRQRTARFMRHRDVSLIVATGGDAMVRAAYSSGTPALGVGAGNAPVLIGPDADLDYVAACVVSSKSFDNGLICGAEQHLVADGTLVDGLVQALRDADAVVLDRTATEAFVAKAFLDSGRLRAAHIGRSAAEIAAATEVAAPPGTLLLVITGDAHEVKGAYATERLAPIVTLYATDGESEAIDLCRSLLQYEGTGHTAVIHSEDEELIDRFARAMPSEPDPGRGAGVAGLRRRRHRARALHDARLRDVRRNGDHRQRRLPQPAERETRRPY